MAPCVLRLKSSIVFHNCVSKKSSGPVQNTEYSPPTGTINVADLEFWICFSDPVFIHPYVNPARLYKKLF